MYEDIAADDTNPLPPTVLSEPDPHLGVSVSQPQGQKITLSEPLKKKPVLVDQPITNLTPIGDPKPPAPLAEKTSRPHDAQPRRSIKFLLPSAVSRGVTQLPQQASSQELIRRSAELAANQILYQYEAPTSIPNVAFVKGPYSSLPGQSPSLMFRLRVSLAIARILVNNLCAANRSALFSSILAAAKTVIDAIFADGEDNHAISNALQRNRHRLDSTTYQCVISAAKATKTLGDRGLRTDFEEENLILEPFRKLYAFLVRPRVSDVFLEDKVFARMRVAGFNPMSLFRVRSMAELPFSIEEKHSQLLAADSVAQALSTGRLYALDLSFVAAVRPKASSPPMLFLPSKAVFVLPENGDGNLVPVAVELDGSVVYPPDVGDPDTRWDIAKMALNTCDAAHHELIAHLGRTHLLIEPFVAATNRRLASTHPLYRLLTPHFEGTIFINETASQNLVAKGGDVDRIFAGDITSVMTWCSEQVRKNPFNASMPDVELAARGLLDAPLSFPYRDDAIAHFTALIAWVDAYIRHYYKCDADVIADQELKSWAAELVDPSYGQLKDFGDSGQGKIRTREYLVRAVAFIIFTASVQHASVNFPQSTLMSYAPALGGAQYAPAPPKDRKADVEDWTRMLTPLTTAAEQITILNTIGAVYHTQLGHYPRNQFCDANHPFSWPDPIRKAHSQYLHELQEIDKRIVRREVNSDLRYDYLRPANIPQSINI